MSVAFQLMERQICRACGDALSRWRVPTVPRRPAQPFAIALVVLAVLGFITFGRTAFAQEVTIVDVVRIALSRNERAPIADLTVDSADAAVTRARAGFFPTVTLTASETLRPYTEEQNGRTLVRSNAASGAVTVNQPLLSVTTFPLYTSAKHAYESARHSARDQRQKLAYDAARGFFAVVAQERLLAAAKRRLERAEANLNDTRARAQAQIASSNDVTRSEVDHAGAQQSVLSAMGAVQQARINLEYIVDTPLEGSLKTADVPLAPATLDLPALLQQALTQRPDLASARESASAASAAAAEPRLRFVPTVGASAQARLADQTISGDRYYDTTLAFNLTWNIWDAGQRSADAQTRDAAAQTADLQARQLRRKVEADVRNAAAALAAARAALDAANRAVDGALRNVEETAVLYRQGLARAIELVDANLSRYDAEVALAGAQLSLRQAELDLRAALGIFPVDGVQ